MGHFIHEEPLFLHFLHVIWQACDKQFGIIRARKGRVESRQENDAVIRRKLFTYTVIFIAGISAGFFVIERTALVGGALFAVAVTVIICCMDDSGFCMLVTHGRLSRQKKILLLSFIFGFALFVCRYVWYGTSLRFDSTEIKNHSIQINESDYQSISAESINRIEGLAESLTIRDGKMKIVLADTDRTKRGVRVLVSVKVSEEADGSVYPDPVDIIGRRITAYGRMSEPAGADNPGCFDYRIYLRSRGIGYLFNAQGVEPDYSNYDSEANEISTDGYG